LANSNLFQAQVYLYYQLDSFLFINETVSSQVESLSKLGRIFLPTKQDDRKQNLLYLFYLVFFIFAHFVKYNWFYICAIFW